MINQKIKLFYFIFSCIGFAFTSCAPYKNIPYYQDLKNDPVTTEKMNNRVQYFIHTGDILGVNVSSRNPESAAVFNYNLARVNGNNYNTSPENPVIGYLVDDNGMIHLPLVGAIKVEGLSTNDVTEKLGVALLTYLKDPVVNIRIVNFKVYVYGDVLRPNVYTLQDDHTTVTQALTLAGDLNITALRKKVLLIRNEGGERKYIKLDLTSKQLFNSPYFYLQNNDEIYVSPGRAKTATQGFPLAGLVISGLSVIAILLTHYYK
ncbi:polysaccharide biosynthesis/export family protein [Mucilaginibacter sp. SP1R1]|uniref:polysaccharide biosynthesis/export family protein n=1 Tax=Mucilaginibacter sp. SP1R1 TaxID=2723091 RepID=UPI00160C49D1|nr:polysaccharide biosynthesis/export family protein [Mucilaginibacter sp. SP1R1]MBB6148314.1 polysaccharide export outer membrane protein [Mucilaginibacter sp. SP1R1]